MGSGIVVRNGSEKGILFSCSFHCYTDCCYRKGPHLISNEFEPKDFPLLVTEQVIHTTVCYVRMTYFTKTFLHQLLLLPVAYSTPLNHQNAPQIGLSFSPQILSSLQSSSEHTFSTSFPSEWSAWSSIVACETSYKYALYDSVWFSIASS